MNRYAIWIVVALIVVGLGLFLTKNKPESAPTTSTSGPHPTTQTQPQDDGASDAARNSGGASQTPEATTITITPQGFTPASATVKTNTPVKFINNDNAQHWPASDPHPTHTGLSGFDALHGLAPTESYTYTFTKAGTWSYHDHLNPTLKGSVTVTEN